MRKEGGILAIGLNSIEFTKEDPRVVELSLAPGSYVVLKISDTGQGMSQVTQDRIFDPYFTTKKKGEGTGMGLAVVHGIVSRLGGHISVFSELGKGTTFKVYLPQSEITSYNMEENKDDHLQTGNERILVVDDNKDVLSMEIAMLKSFGYKVTGMTNGEDALKTFMSQPDTFDLVITDMTMPDITGAELSQKLLSIRPDILIILCSGYNELINQDKAKAIGIKEYLMKPIVRNEMATIVRAVFENKE